MPDDNDLSIDEINELFNSVIEGPDEWLAGSSVQHPAFTNKEESGSPCGAACIGI